MRGRCAIGGSSGNLGEHSRAEQRRVRDDGREILKPPAVFSFLINFQAFKLPVQLNLYSEGVRREDL